ncbi:CsbD family protein [Streptomyces spongiicola]|uniref:CsbD family protein n=1 Tax=Streptomyces spongiicola TaxID=1690221 RepID=UPI00340DF735
MAADGKTQARIEQVRGKVKETVGRAVGNGRMTAEGRAEQSMGDMREAKEKAGDAFHR